MGAAITIGITGHSEDFGDFTTGLYVWEGSSSDPLSASSPFETVRARDLLAGIPVLWWRPGMKDEGALADRLLEVFGRAQAIAIGAVEFDPSHEPPLTVSAVPSSTLLVHADAVELFSTSRPLGLLHGNRFPIDPRLARFLRLCETLSVVIETPTAAFVASFVIDERPPQQVFHEGTLRMKSFASVVEHSDKWAPATLGSMSLLAGMADLADHHVRTYMATPSACDLPDRISYVGPCLACGGPGNSREHCLPRWIANAHNVVPVVAPLFCVSCNSHFGAEVEAPLAIEVRANGLSGALHTELFARWAVKTALTLSAASEVRFPNEWMREIRAGVISEDFQIFANANAVMEPGYLFSVTHFSRAERHNGLFLLTFAMNGLLFVVLRNPTGTIELPGLDRLRPEPHARSVAQTIDVVKLHDHIVAALTGHEILRSV